MRPDLPERVTPPVPSDRRHLGQHRGLGSIRGGIDDIDLAADAVLAPLDWSRRGPNHRLTAMDGTYAATVDRIVDGETAVLLLEADGDIVEQLGVPAERLPEPAQRDGVLSVTIEDDELVSAEYLAEETRDRRGSLRGRLERLSKRLSDPD